MSIFGSNVFGDKSPEQAVKDNVEWFVDYFKQGMLGSHAFVSDAKVFYEVVVPSLVIQYYLNGYYYRAGFVYAYFGGLGNTVVHIAVLADRNEDRSGGYIDPILVVYDTKQIENSCWYDVKSWHLDDALAARVSQEMAYAAVYAGDKNKYISSAALFGLLRKLIVNGSIFCDMLPEFLSAADEVFSSESSRLDAALDEIRDVLKKYLS